MTIRSSHITKSLRVGGWGLVETEATYIDAEYSQCRRGQPGMAMATHRDAWLGVVEAVHAHGAAVFMQLQHAGAFAEARRYGWNSWRLRRLRRATRNRCRCRAN